MIISSAWKPTVSPCWRQNNRCKSNKSAIEQHAKAYAPATDSLQPWYAEAVEAAWMTAEQMEAQFQKASIIANNRVVFVIAGNGYRLIVSMNYKF